MLTSCCTSARNGNVLNVWSLLCCGRIRSNPIFIADELRYYGAFEKLNVNKMEHWGSSRVQKNEVICGTPSEFLSSSIPSWQILTAHAQPFRGARDVAFCLKVPLDSLLVWASSGGSGVTARMHRLAWTFAARIGDKYQIRLTRPIFKINWKLHKNAKKINKASEILQKL